MLPGQKHNAPERVFEGDGAGDILDGECLDFHAGNGFADDGAAKAVLDFYFLKQIAEGVLPIFFMVLDGVGVPIAEADSFFVVGGIGEGQRLVEGFPVSFFDGDMGNCIGCFVFVSFPSVGEGRVKGNLHPPIEKGLFFCLR